MDFVRPFVKKGISWAMGELKRDLVQFERMESPRVIKSHMPLYLLNPTLLDTSKVMSPILDISTSVFFCTKRRLTIYF